VSRRAMLKWCPEPGSNRYTPIKGWRILSPLRLPISPSGHDALRDDYRGQNGAGNEARTRDLNLGKVALYQLSYSRLGSHLEVSHCT
jgi:hypothetical protein